MHNRIKISDTILFLFILFRSVFIRMKKQPYCNCSFLPEHFSKLRHSLYSAGLYGGGGIRLTWWLTRRCRRSRTSFINCDSRPSNVVRPRSSDTAINMNNLHYNYTCSICYNIIDILRIFWLSWNKTFFHDFVANFWL